MNEILHGDCLSILKTIPSESIDLILTDPPYGMDYHSSRRSDKFDKIENDNNLDWLQDFVKESFRVLKQDTHIYLFCNDLCIGAFRDCLELCGFNVKRTLVWVKNNHTSGDLLGDYANKTEFIIYAQKGRRLLNEGRDTNVLYFDRVNELEHPTQKPVTICEYLISKSTSKNDTVLDPFCGSGSSLVASKNLERNYIGIEMVEEYVNIARKRTSIAQPHLL